MSTLHINDQKAGSVLRAAVYVAIAAFLALFGFIYENYSHDVFSYSMVYAFAPALIAAGFYLLCGLIKAFPVPRRVLNFFVDAAVATFTMGLLLKGAVEIYGSDNELIPIFFYVGAGFAALTAVSFIISFFVQRNKA